MKYEKLVGEYERLAGSSLDENLKIATVMRCSWTVATAFALSLALAMHR